MPATEPIPCVAYASGRGEGVEPTSAPMPGDRPVPAIRIRAETVPAGDLDEAGQDHNGSEDVAFLDPGSGGRGSAGGAASAAAKDQHDTVSTLFLRVPCSEDHFTRSMDESLR